MNTVTVSQALPEFQAEATSGTISQESFKGQPTVLFFYPRNNTPGCTTESLDFREHYNDFLETGWRVIGISRDTLRSHQNVVKKHDLPYPLIADPEETICNLFGVMKQKNMYGKQVRGIERSTFLIDADGIVIKEWRKVSVPGHVDEVLQTIHTLANA